MYMMGMQSRGSLKGPMPGPCLTELMVEAGRGQPRDFVPALMRFEQIRSGEFVSRAMLGYAGSNIKGTFHHRRLRTSKS